MEVNFPPETSPLFFERVWAAVSHVWEVITQVALKALLMLQEGLKALFCSSSPAPQEIPLPPLPEGVALPHYYKHLLATLWDVLQHPEEGVSSAEKAVRAPFKDTNVQRIWKVPIEVSPTDTVKKQTGEFFAHCEENPSQFSAALWTSDQGACLFCVDSRQREAHHYLIYGCQRATLTEETDTAIDSLFDVLQGDNRSPDQPSPWNFEILDVH